MTIKNQTREPRADDTPLPDVVPVVSLFCGAGGLDLGFYQEGFRSLLAIDNEQAAVDSFNANFAEKPALKQNLASIRTSAFLEVVRKAVSSAGQAPKGLLGGPPCQGVSNANNSAAPEDPRNTLMTTYIRLLNALDDEYGLDFFVFENVPGLLRSRNRERFSRLKRELGRRFHINVQQVNAHDFGVPQHRDRILIYGLHKARFAAAPGSLVPDSTARKTVRDAIGNLDEEPAFFTRGADSSSFPLHPNHWTMNPKSPKFGATSTATGRSFMRLSWDAPSKTVAYGHREIHVHPRGHRRLSVYESLLLQGFPPAFELKGCLSAQVQQVSNAVPPPLAKVVAAHLRSELRKGVANAAER